MNLFKLPLSIIFIASWYSVSSANANTLYVNIKSPYCNDQRGTPFCHIRPAIKASRNKDIINIASGNYKETLHINKDLVIKGENKENTIIDAQEKTNVVKIDPGSHVQLLNLTLHNGLADNGGGILNQGSLMLNSVRIIYNTAKFSGGGIFNASSVSGSLVIRNSQISHNKSLGNDEQNLKYGGGGIFNNSPLLIEKSTLSFNYSKNNGGGLYSIFTGRNKFGDGEVFAEKLGMVSKTERQRNLKRKIDADSVSIKNSLINFNTANTGGGINLHGVLNLSKSTLSQNMATNGALSEGGGLFAHFDNKLSMSDVLINYNQATFRGGGIRYYSSRSGKFSNVSIIDNRVLEYFGKGAGIFIITSENPPAINNSLIARNYVTQLKQGILKIDDCNGIIKSLGANYLSKIEQCKGFDKLNDYYVPQLDQATPYHWNSQKSQYQIPKSSQLQKIIKSLACNDKPNETSCIIGAIDSLHL